MKLLRVEINLSAVYIFEVTSCFVSVYSLTLSTDTIRVSSSLVCRTIQFSVWVN